MVEILPEVPSFGQLLGRGLGGGIGQGLSQAAQFAQQMALQKQKEALKHDFYSQFLGSPMGEEEPMKGFKPLSPQQETILALEDPKAFTAYSNLKESHGKEQEKAQQKENLQGTLGEMIDTLSEGRLGYTPKRLSKKGRRDVQYFDTLGTQLESIGKDMVSKGVLSAPRFAYLLGNLPSSGKTDAANAGAIEAWAQELKLDVPGIEKLKALYESPEDIKKTKPGTPLDLETMEKIYKKTGGDKEKAKAVAKKMGYDIE